MFSPLQIHNYDGEYADRYTDALLEGQLVLEKQNTGDGTEDDSTAREDGEEERAVND